VNSRPENAFPAGLPEHLVTAAFVSREPAWKQRDCAEVIGWLSNNGYAVLGAELWLTANGTIRTLMNTERGRVLYSTHCDPLPEESWDKYVQRCAQLLAESVSAFRWPEDSLENPASAYFNLTWADRDWFRSRGEFQD
jgi:hypothetical protein